MISKKGLKRRRTRTNSETENRAKLLGGAIGPHRAALHQENGREARLIFLELWYAIPIFRLPGRWPLL